MSIGAQAVIIVDSTGTPILASAQPLNVPSFLPGAVASGPGISTLWAWNVAAAAFERLEATDDNSDAQGTSNGGHLGTVSHAYIFNGVSWDRVRSASAAAAGAATQLGVGLVTGPAQWTSVHEPAAAAQATATRAAAGAGIRNVCRSITASLACGAAAAGPLFVRLRDGASGLGAVLWSATLSAPVNGSGIIQLNDLNIPGSPNTAMTLEFSAAGAAGSQEVVTLGGYSIG